MSNPLIDKFYEIHPEKKEIPNEEVKKLDKNIKIECDVKIKKQEMEKFQKAFSSLPHKVMNPNTGFQTTIPNSANREFLRVAEQIVNDRATVYSYNIEYDEYNLTPKITFVVYRH